MLCSMGILLSRVGARTGGHRPMEEDIRMKDGSKAVINHGFSTSTAEEQLYFLKDYYAKHDDCTYVNFLSQIHFSFEALTFFCLSFSLKYRCNKLTT